jgi:hypothetical protein
MQVYPLVCFKLVGIQGIETLPILIAGTVSSI